MFDPPFDAATQSALRKHLLTLRIIVFALAASVISFQAVILFLHGPPSGKLVLEPLALIGFVLAPLNAVLSFILPFFIRSALEKSGGPASPEQAAQRIQMETIIGCALLEGVSLVNLVTVFLYQSAAHLVIANILLLLLITRFPLFEEAYFRKVEQRSGRRGEDFPTGGSN